MANMRLGNIKNDLNLTTENAAITHIINSYASMKAEIADLKAATRRLSNAATSAEAKILDIKAALTSVLEHE